MYRSNQRPNICIYDPWPKTGLKGHIPFNKIYNKVFLSNIIQNVPNNKTPTNKIS